MSSTNLWNNLGGPYTPINSLFALRAKTTDHLPNQ